YVGNPASEQNARNPALSKCFDGGMRCAFPPYAAAGGTRIDYGSCSSKLRYGSTVTVAPGTIKVVASICSTIADPSMRLPARSFSRAESGQENKGAGWPHR